MNRQIHCNKKIKCLKNLPQGTEELVCQYCDLEKITSLPETLKDIFIDSCPNLNELPLKLSKNLTRIQVKNCPKLHFIPDFTELKQLDYFLYNNESDTYYEGESKNIGKLTLSQFPFSLTVLNLEDSNLEVIPSFPKNIKRIHLLNCNKLKNLPEMMSLKSLEQFTCQNSGILEFPNLPENLEIFICDNCMGLTSLPILPDSLWRISCIGCKIESLPENLPKSLHLLDCSACPIKVLPNLENLHDLRELACNKCPIKYLSPFPKKFKTLYCNNTPLKEFPEFPETFRSISCDGCKNIVTIPKLPDDMFLMIFAETRISKIPHPRGFNSCNCDWCPWLDHRYPDRKERFIKLRKIQKCIKKHLYRRQFEIFRILKTFFPKDICRVILN